MNRIKSLLDTAFSGLVGANTQRHNRSSKPGPPRRIDKRLGASTESLLVRCERRKLALKHSPGSHGH